MSNQKVKVCLKKKTTRAQIFHYFCYENRNKIFLTFSNCNESLHGEQNHKRKTEQICSTYFALQHH